MSEVIIISYPSKSFGFDPINIRVEFDSDLIGKYIHYEYGRYILDSRPLDLEIHAAYKIITENIACKPFIIPRNLQPLPEFNTDEKTVYFHELEGKKYYYGVYYSGNINGIYSIDTNYVINWFFKPEIAYNVVNGVINYLISINLMKKYSILRTHSSSILYNNKIYLICGLEQSGKSILTSYFCHQLKNYGFKFNSDDITFVYQKDGRVIAFPFIIPIKFNDEHSNFIQNLTKDSGFLRINTSNNISRLLFRVEDLGYSIDNSPNTLGGVILVEADKKNASSVKKITNRVENCLFRSFYDNLAGKGLLNIDYLNALENKPLIKQLFETITNNYPFYLINIGKNIDDLEKILDDDKFF